MENYENHNNGNPEYRSAKISIIAIIPQIIIFIFFIIVAMYVNSLYTLNTDYTIFRVLFFLLLFFAARSVLKIIQIIIIKITTKLKIYDDKILGKKGLLNTVNLDSPLNKINDVIIAQGKIFNYATIIIYTSSNKYFFPYIENAKLFKDTLYFYINKIENTSKESKKVENGNKYENLKTIKALLDDGVISKEEFESDNAKKFFNIDYLIKLLEQHKNHKKDNYKKIWIIYTFLKWYEVYFN